jgi:myo-inositol 2-dehydrogenase/D-chiro-inositol 1-dehydrogenase
MTDIVRYGLVGAGMMGREHIRNLALVPGAVVTAVSDPDADQRAMSAAAAGGAKPFADHRDLLESGLVDALVIASPNDTHMAILGDIFAAPKALPILVEKPVCTTLADCDGLERAAAAYGAPIWVAMEYRYMPPVAELLREVRAGTVGRLRMFAIREHRFPFLKKVGDWNRFTERTGGTLVEKCCHFFDLMRLVAADEPVRVYASGAADVNHRDESYGGRVPDILDNAFVIVDFRSGIRAMLDLCMFAEGSYWQEELAATGSAGKVEAFVPGPARFWPGGGERASEILVSPREPKNPVRRQVHVDEAILMAGDHHGSTYYQHMGFNRVVRQGGAVEVTMADGLMAVRIGLAAERSIRESVPVALWRGGGGLGAERFGPERFGPERFGPEGFGPEGSGPEGSGLPGH